MHVSNSYNFVASLSVLTAFANAAVLPSPGHVLSSPAPRALGDNVLVNGGFEASGAWTGSSRAGFPQGYLTGSISATDYAFEGSSAYTISTSGPNTASLRGYCVSQTVSKPRGSYKFSAYIGRISHANTASPYQEAVTVAVAINNGRAILQNSICDSDASRGRLCPIKADNGVPTYDYVETRFTTTVDQIKVDICTTWTSSVTDGSRMSDEVLLDKVQVVAA
ncbi:hypothetical protein ACJQWK_01960 [Exserohilum turcicum]|uniref:Uncharacterized protein n=1 Tax=Exserohilum turcicum (strain 28A) TaxID=671987 RepID=R0KGY5_EXST2|nr:uncharacterized protein SETTUDRAFT_168393 [Exserohilum turcica Et28A]EOA88524.1 hypothetical protein SETTUDRAFT_168393 [Exserohilum turcica Et28A]